MKHIVPTFALVIVATLTVACTEDNPTNSTDGIIATDSILVDPSYADTIYHNFDGDSVVTLPIPDGDIEEDDANEAV